MARNFLDPMGNKVPVHSAGSSTEGFVKTFYSGFPVVAGVSEYDVFAQSESVQGSHWTNLPSDQGMATGTTFIVSLITIRGFFVNATPAGVTAANLAAAQQFLSASIYRIGWNQKADYGILRPGLALGTISATLDSGNTNGVAIGGDIAVGGNFPLPVPLPMEEQWPFASKFIYTAGNVVYAKSPTFTAAPVLASLVTAGFQVFVSYTGVLQRKV